MPRCARMESDCNTYHVMARGTAKQIIFEDDVDRIRFTTLMNSLFCKFDISIFAYVLMDNHFHVLAQAPLPSISNGMRRLLGSYALWFNERHRRCGHLFGGRFRSEPIEDDDYLLTVVRYIHNNPAVAGLSPAADWKWSSYQDYLGKPGITNRDLILNMLGGIDAFEIFHRLEHEGKLPIDIPSASMQVKRLTNEEAYAMAANLIGEDALIALKQTPREERRTAIRLLKDNGIGVRQIQRLTGLPLGSISEA